VEKEKDDNLQKKRTTRNFLHTRRKRKRPVHHTSGNLMLGSINGSGEKTGQKKETRRKRKTEKSGGNTRENGVRKGQTKVRN